MKGLLEYTGTSNTKIFSTPSPLRKKFIQDARSYLRLPVYSISSASSPLSCFLANRYYRKPALLASIGMMNFPTPSNNVTRTGAINFKSWLLSRYRDVLNHQTLTFQVSNFTTSPMQVLLATVFAATHGSSIQMISSPSLLCLQSREYHQSSPLLCPVLNLPQQCLPFAPL